MSFAPKLTMSMVLIVGIVGLVFLFLYNPADIQGFPRCPFYALTGYKCPGCGTLRGIHSLLHLRFQEAWSYNPLMVVSMPVLLLMMVFPRFRQNVFVSRLVLWGVVSYWVLRNVL